MTANVSELKRQPSYVRPPVSAGAHPVETGRYVIATPPVCLLYEKVRGWVANRASGVAIYGKQRFGKTRAIRYLVAELKQEFGQDLPILCILCRDCRVPTESAFFENLLRALNHAITTGTATTKRDRLTEFLYEQSQRTGGGKRLIIILDEAQKLHEMQYRWLVDVHNELDDRGVNLTWLLVGQEELIHMREVFVKTKKQQLIGRFMTHQHVFTGVTSASDFEFCLASYDDPTRTEYPPGSGWSYTRYYFPAAYENGFRLAGEAENLWQAFHKVRVESRLPADAEIPMQYFAGTVEYALKTYGSTDEVPHLSLNAWREAIQSSGYHDAARYL
jgi:hypothetical protein